MISIIVSSYKAEQFNQFSKSVAQTIGVEYEMIKIHNPGLMGICEAYNKGVAQAKYDVLCFCHEDIIFHTKGWGSDLMEIFNAQPNCGLIGIAGTRGYAKNPGPWWEQGVKENRVRHIQQSSGNHTSILYSNGWDGEQQTQKNVVAIDGCFMCLRKSTNILFDENFTGYHAYDITLSLDVFLAGWNVVVTNKFLIEHLSNGCRNKNWYEMMDIFYEKYKSKLPLTVGEKVPFYDQINSYIYYIQGCLDYGLKSLALKYWKKLVLIAPFKKYHFTFLKRILQAK